jgi:hypothetical protein
MKIPTRLFEDILHLPYPAMAYRLSQRIHDQFPGFGILETEDSDFRLESFSEAGGCAATVRRDIFGHSMTKWNDQMIVSTPQTAVMDVEWRGQWLRVFRVRYDDYCSERFVIVGASIVIAEAFFAAVCRFATSSNETIAVMSSDGFRRDDQLRENLKKYAWTGLDWLPDLQRELERNCADFFAAEATYKEHRLPWKRGIIMYGPPGNGKTHAIKTLINRLGKPVVYVRTFARRKSLDTDNIEAAFRRARELAPCLLILEDLDTLVRRDSLAFFLNELDGLRSNHGILTLATTNHLEKLDPALTQRPSRFDRKIAVGSPNRESRQKFLTARLGIDVVDEAALDDTDGFSIAFLTELITSVRLAQMKDPSRSLSEILAEVIGELRSQVASVAPSEDGDDD